MASPTLSSLQPHIRYSPSSWGLFRQALQALVNHGHADMARQLVSRCYACDGDAEVRRVIEDYVVIDPPKGGNHRAAVGE